MGGGFHVWRFSCMSDYKGDGVLIIFGVRGDNQQNYHISRDVHSNYIS